MGFNDVPGANTNRHEVPKTVRSNPELWATQSRTLDAKIDIENRAKEVIADMFTEFSTQYPVDGAGDTYSRAEALNKKDEFLARIQARVKKEIDELFEAREKHILARNANKAERESRKNE